MAEDDIVMIRGRFTGLPLAQNRNRQRQRGGLPLLPEDGLHPGRHTANGVSFPVPTAATCRSAIVGAGFRCVA
jgi:hypothetical protein